MSEEMIVRYCAPTLAGIKAGNLFTCAYESETALREDIRSLNRRLSGKGLRILPLKTAKSKALIYVYRPSKLKEHFSHVDAVTLLEDRGYSCEHPGRCIVRLASRLKASEDFPHEIGLFLGYPPEDVQGFIENGAKNSKFTGHWKVYGDPKKAKKLFAKYQRCTEQHVRRLTRGVPIERLTVAG